MGYKKLNAFYKSKIWRDTREYVLMRDNYICRNCAKKGLIIPAEVVHHIKHLDELNVDDVTISLNPDNLISLCAECHFEEHRGEHCLGRQHEAEYGYCFDENGQLVPK